MPSQSETTVDAPIETKEPALPGVDLLDYLLFVPFVLAFVGILLVMEVVQRLALLFGAKAHRITVRWLNQLLLACLHIVGTKIEIKAQGLGDSGKPYIIVSNHQSLFDIPLLYCIFARHDPRFIAKKELGRNIPSVSLNLRHGGGALIDRNNPRQALPEIKKLGVKLIDEKFAAALFPEGTRAKRGLLKEFHHAGLASLLASAPGVDIIPVAIDGAWKLAGRKFGPIPRGIEVKVRVLPIVTPDANGGSKATREISEKLRAEIGQALIEMRAE